MKIDRIEVVVDESVDEWMGAGERLKSGREVEKSEREKLRIRRKEWANISEKGRGGVQTGSVLACKITGAACKINAWKTVTKRPGIEINDLSIAPANQLAETSGQKIRFGGPLQILGTCIAKRAFPVL